MQDNAVKGAAISLLLLLTPNYPPQQGTTFHPVGKKPDRNKSISKFSPLDQLYLNKCHRLPVLTTVIGMKQPLIYCFLRGVNLGCKLVEASKEASTASMEARTTSTEVFATSVEAVEDSTDVFMEVLGSFHGSVR